MDLGIKYQGKILRLMTLSWEDPRFLVPHMQTALLKKLQQYPTAWTDLPIVEKELALRAQKFTRKDLQKTPSKAPVKFRDSVCSKQKKEGRFLVSYL
jgi:hypothetical protein